MSIFQNLLPATAVILTMLASSNVHADTPILKLQMPLSVLIGGQADAGPAIDGQAGPVDQGNEFSWVFTSREDVTWSIESSPSWLTLTPAGRTATISGTPEGAEPFSALLKVTAAGGRARALQIGPITPAPYASMSAAFSPGFPDAAMRGSAFSTTVDIKDGRPPYVVSLVGEAPAGFALANDSVTLSGNFLDHVSSLHVRVRDALGNSRDIYAGPVTAVDLLELTGAVSNITTNDSSVARVSAPSHIGGYGNVSKTLVGSLPAGASYNSSTGIATFDKVARGTYGPYSFRIADQFNQVVLSSTFHVQVTGTPGMKLSLPNGAEFFFKGWTAQPQNVAQIEVNSLGWTIFRVSCVPSGTANFIILQGSQEQTIEPAANGVASCPGSLTWAEWWPVRMGQAFPIHLSTVKTGNKPTSGILVYTGSQAVWTRVN